MSDTPRTGALLESILIRDRFLSDKNAPEEWVVYARTLERELAAANQKIQRLVEAGDKVDAFCVDENAHLEWTAAKEKKAS